MSKWNYTHLRVISRYRNAAEWHRLRSSDVGLSSDPSSKVQPRGSSPGQGSGPSTAPNLSYTVRGES